MPQPPPYSRVFSFTDDEAAQPAAHVPGASIDGEFDAIAATIKQVLLNLLKLQRDDGAMKNAIVTLDSLSPGVILTLGAGSRWTPRGAWAPAVDYAVSDVVAVDTSTFVCALEHISAATFAAEPADAWILVFDSAGAIPADGSVTAVKIADGAVTDAALGITHFDISGYGRAAGGIAAGIAPVGSLFHAKLDVGDVHAKAERTTDVQGAVGLQIISPGATWAVEMAAGSTDLHVTVGGVAIAAIREDGSKIDVAAGIRACAAGGLDANTGVTMTFAASVGYVKSRDDAQNQWRDLKLQGANVYLTAGGVDVLKATPTGVDFPVGLTNKGIAVGFLGIPQNEQDGPYTVQTADIGKDIYSVNAVAQTITVPVLPGGSALTITNDGTSPITLHGDGVTLKLSGTATTGDRTIGANGQALLTWVGDGTKVRVAGPGVS